MTSPIPIKDLDLSQLKISRVNGNPKEVDELTFAYLTYKRQSFFKVKVNGVITTELKRNEEYPESKLFYLVKLNDEDYDLFYKLEGILEEGKTSSALLSTLGFKNINEFKSTPYQIQSKLNESKELKVTYTDKDYSEMTQDFIESLSPGLSVELSFQIGLYFSLKSSSDEESSKSYGHYGFFLSRPKTIISK